MKILSQLSRAGRLRRAGSILVITLIFCMLIGTVMVAYLSMIKSQHKFTYRAQTWNNCIPLCEAGVEEVRGSEPALLSGFSPESGRKRGGDLGADPGNRPGDLQPRTKIPAEP